MSAFSTVFRQCLPSSRQALGKPSTQLIARCMATKAAVAKTTTSRHRPSAPPIDDDKKRSGFLKIDSPASRAFKSLYRIPADPFAAATRVERLLQMTSHDDALEYLTHLRVGLQSAAAWNALLKHCAAQGKIKLAESDYLQMRKRGIKPNEHTHTIMISAWGHSRSPNAVAKAEAWLDERIEGHPSLVHYNALFTVYQQHGVSMNKAWDRVKKMPLRPDAITYSILFQCALPGDEARVRRAWNEILRRVSDKDSSRRRSTSSSLLAQKAMQIKIELGETAPLPEESVFELDDKLAANLLAALLRTETDLAFGMDVIERLYGLRYPPPADANNHGEDLGLVPTVQSLDTILRLFGTRKAYRQGREFYDLALEKFPGIKPDSRLLDTRAWLESRRYRTQWKQQQQQQHKQS